MEDRSASRLLVLHRQTGEISHKRFRDCPDLFEPGDLLVLNETRVSAVRLFGRKPTGGAVEVLLLSGTAPRYRALVKPGRRLRLGTEIEFEDLVATVVHEHADGQKDLEFKACKNLAERIQELGEVPLPPYIQSRISDPERYQTVYGETSGSAAAPTAGLHFTREILEAIQARGVALARVSLDVGLDTFRPVQAENLDEHQMHGELCRVPVETAQLIESCTGRVIAIGTTTVRTLETFATAKRRISPGETVSRLFIRPGFSFRIVDGMFTNFHLPETTMMMMISALATRESIARAYASAIEHEYRFLSFGDSMLIL